MVTDDVVCNLFSKTFKKFIFYEKCFNFGSKDQHYKIEGLDPNRGSNQL